MPSSLKVLKQAAARNTENFISPTALISYAHKIYLLSPHTPLTSPLLVPTASSTPNAALSPPMVSVVLQRSHIQAARTDSHGKTASERQPRSWTSASCVAWTICFLSPPLHTAPSYPSPKYSAISCLQFQPQPSSSDVQYFAPALTAYAPRSPTQLHKGIE